MANGVGQRVAILAVVAADKIALGRGDDTTIGHHTIHIEDHRFDAGYIFFEVSHISWLISS